MGTCVLFHTSTLSSVVERGNNAFWSGTIYSDSPLLWRRKSPICTLCSLDTISSIKFVHFRLWSILHIFQESLLVWGTMFKIEILGNRSLSHSLFDYRLCPTPASKSTTKMLWSHVSIWSLLARIKFDEAFNLERMFQWIVDEEQDGTTDENAHVHSFGFLFKIYVKPECPWRGRILGKFVQNQHWQNRGEILLAPQLVFSFH